ncbi:hypothetical protein TNCV_4834711 [Trichonephila clavipes]|nr:hypothetical protein TNCV_4834711 [Trichonephila clavipes]
MDKRASRNLQKATASEEQQSGKGKESSASTDSKEKKAHTEDYTKVLKCSHPQDKLDSEIVLDFSCFCERIEVLPSYTVLEKHEK